MTKLTATITDDRWDLPERLDHAGGAALADELARRRGRQVVLGAQTVRYLGGLAAEILLRARAEWQAGGMSFAVRDPSADFVQGLDLLGIEHAALIDEGTE